MPAGYTWLGYDQGKIPASTLIAAVPFGMEAMGVQRLVVRRRRPTVGEQLYAKYDVHPIYCGLIGPETAGWFRDPIESLDDIAGLKIRFAGLGGKVMEQHRGVRHDDPGGEIFQALEKGAIDASEYSLPVVDEALGFDRIAKFNYFPGWHQPFSAVHLAVNKPVWDSLDAPNAVYWKPPALPASPAISHVAKRCRDRCWRASTPAACPRCSCRNRCCANWSGWLTRCSPQEAERDQDFRTIYAAQREFRKAYARWKQLAYLPRDF